MKINIQLEDTLIKALEEGVNLFVGAGFSVLAKNADGKTLPVGEQLLKELKEFFKDIPDSLDLPKAAMYLEKINKEKFYKYIKERYIVDSYNDNYNSLLSLNIKGIYTTNIDNLFVKIFDNSTSMYLSDITMAGAVFNESKSVTYVPLHGSIYNDERKLIFSSADLSSAFSNDRDIWQYLRMAVEKHPTIFWGYKLNDSGVIQTLFSNSERESLQKTKWIVLREGNESEVKYFEALGFNIIIADTESLLAYFKEKQIDISEESDAFKLSKTFYASEFKDMLIPKIGTGPIRPLSEFFLGAAPVWNDIFSNKIYKTSHYEKLIDVINKESKNIIVVGTPVSGKTTLMMQIAANYKFNGVKLLSSYVSSSRAEIINKRFTHEKLLLFIDNLRDNLEAVDVLCENKNIKLICFEREHNYDVISHRVNESEFEFYDTTTLTRRDLQSIYDSIPANVKKRTLTIESTNESIFEFVCQNVEKQNVRDRFLKVFKELGNHSEDLLDLFIMCCYCRNCRIPVSLDMAYAFLSDEVNDYDEVLDTIDQLGKLVTDYDYTDPVIDKDQDYFQARSHIVAETIMNHVPGIILKRVITRFHENVPTFRIVNYAVFKKTAYDKDYFVRAFNNWEEGKEFYDFLYERDRDYYMLQQAALYLANKKKFPQAFDYIDLAIRKSEGRIFSIKNTHAIILFEANINENNENTIVRQNLDKSMNILSECYRIDRRKYYHVRIFAVQSISYFKKYNDSIAKDYLQTSKERLTKEIANQPLYRHKRLRELLRDISLILQAI